ncbi:hypothetical protein HBB16_13880 [Pseudonocardia sp. MCCB 268]|nr:hypothetical protein [Pseudonocardia cytotoxica]
MRYRLRFLTDDRGPLRVPTARRPPPPQPAARHAGPPPTAALWRHHAHRRPPASPTITDDQREAAIPAVRRWAAEFHARRGNAALRPDEEVADPERSHRHYLRISRAEPAAAGPVHHFSAHRRRPGCRAPGRRRGDQVLTSAPPTPRPVPPPTNGPWLRAR